MKRDLSPVLGSIRHVAQTLGNAEHLDRENSTYAASHENPKPAAAWIADDMRKHLGSLASFCDAMGSETGGYQLVKRRRAEDH